MIAESMKWFFLFVAGGLLGVFYFGGLWITVRQISHWKHPALVMSLSMLTRVVITVAGFYWLTSGQWKELVIALIGFIVIRMIMVRRYGPATVQPLTNS